jgi:poly-gamma-glutamate synthesis protein (capsule biosynthesis protein)
LTTTETSTSTIPAWWLQILQIAAVLGLYVVTRQPWGSLTRLTAAVFDASFLLPRALGERSVLLAVVGAVVVGIVAEVRERRLPPLSHRSALRGIVAAVVVAQAWTLVFGEVNLYSGRAYVLDRVVLAAVALVALRRVAWAPLFLVLSLVVMAQATAGIDALCWTDMRLLLDAQILFAAFLVVRAVLSADTPVFVLVLLVVAAGSYVGPGLDKLGLGATPLAWVREDDLGNIVVAAWLGGWLTSLSSTTVIAVAHVVSALSPVFCFATLCIELGPVFAPLRSRVAAVCLGAAVLMHTMILVLTGIFFWKWIVVDVALAVVCWRHGRALLDTMPLGVRVAAVFVLFATQPILAPQHLGWWDTRLTQAFVVDVVDKRGAVHAFPPLAFAPYDVDFAQSRFFFLGGPAKKTGTFGATNSAPLHQRLQGAKTAADVDKIFTRSKGTADARATARFETFLRRYFVHLNARGGQLPFTPHVPSHIQVRRPAPTWEGQHVAEVRVRLIETLYDGDALVPVGDTLVARVTIPGADGRAPRNTLPPGRELPPSTSTRTPTLGCDRESVLTLAFLGDVLLHKPVYEQVVRDGYASLWPTTQPLFASADIAWANLETTLGCCTDAEGGVRPDPGTAFDDAVYTANDKTGVNTHAALAAALRDAGIDVVSTANNHAMDRDLSGVARTLDVLDAAGLAHSGTRRGPTDPWHTVVERNGHKIAFVACTEWTNRKTQRSRPLVLDCTEDRDVVLDEIKKLAPLYDALVFTPHGGRENRLLPDARLRRLAEDAADAGATLVVTSHPHNAQTWERHTTPDGRTVALLWGRGNTLTPTRSLEARASTIAFVDLVRGPDGHLAAGPIGHVPTAIVVDKRRRELRPGAGDEGDRAALQLIRERWGADAELPPTVPVTPRSLCNTTTTAVAKTATTAATLGHTCTGGISCAAPLVCEETRADEGEGVCTRTCDVDGACGGGRCVASRCRAGCSSDDDCALPTACQQGACVPVE